MTKILAVTIAIIVMLFSFCNDLKAYNGSVQSRINEEAVEYSALDYTLKTKLGIEQGIATNLKKGKKKIRIAKWIAYGGESEDYGKSNMVLIKDLQTRAYNHFHDPLKSWDIAGLNDGRTNHIYNNHYGRDPISPILWGLAPGQQEFPENSTGDWSWGKAREYYYTFLTGKDFTVNAVAVSQGEKEAVFADCFRAVGQVMHLLEDVSVPLHTRNDPHVFPLFGLGRWTYETYAKINLDYLEYTPDQPGDNPPAKLLIDPQPDAGYAELSPVTGLFDRNQYSQALRSFSKLLSSAKISTT